MEGGNDYASPFPWKGLPSAARRGWLPFLRRSRLLFAFPIGERGPRQRRSGALANGVLETIVFPALFHTAFPIQPPPLRGTSFLWKEGMTTRAPSLGRGCRAQRGGVGFLFCGEAASSLPSPCRESFVRRYCFSTYACIRFDGARKAVFSYHSLPHWGRGNAPAVDRVLSYIACLR